MAAEWAVAGGTALLAIATFVLAVSARRQVKVAADHVVAIQRPLVAPIVTLHWFNHGSRQSRIALKNTGLGPAYNVEGGLYWTGGAGGASGILRTMLGPGDEEETRVTGSGININWGAAHGYLRYHDSAGVEWQTHFRFRAVEGAGYDVEVVEVGTTEELGEPAYNPEGRAT
jgi:hypothetical protein